MEPDPTPRSAVNASGGGAPAPGRTHKRRAQAFSNDALRRRLVSIASVIALGVLGIGVYAVFNSTNTAGTAALLIIGPLALFVIAFHDRIRSVEFGGAQIQLALQVKYSLSEAFHLRLAGNYEQAEAEIEGAFDRFVWEQPPKTRQAYAASKEYQRKVLMLLGGYVELEFGGKVQEASSTVSFLPLIDAVMTAEKDPLLGILHSHHKDVCDYLKERLECEKKLRAAVIVRPGPALDAIELVERLEREVRYGALNIDCFLLVQDCDHSDSGEEFCDLVNRRGMHAKGIAWEPESGAQKLESAFLQAILTICDHLPAHFVKQQV